MTEYTFQEAQQIANQMETHIQATYPEVKLYLVEGYWRGNEWTIRFTLPKIKFTKGVKWHDPQHQKKSNQKKRWKCDKFGQIAFPTDKVKAKELSDKLFKEW